MRIRKGWMAVVLFSLTAALRADFDADCSAVGKAMAPLMPKWQERIEAGEVSAGTTELLEQFPAATRTAAQALTLGDALYDFVPRQSYELHKEAFAKDPKELRIVWEWALEQHRVNDYAGALKAYEEYSAKKPNLAAPYALMADCLLHLNRNKAAAEMWEKSEKAKQGSIEQMESLVCAVKREATVFLQREALLTKVKRRDIDAAVELIALDCEFEIDWWNAPAQKVFLENDMAVIRSSKLPPGPRLSAIECRAALATVNIESADDVTRVFKQYGFVIDDKKTLPNDGKLLQPMLLAAVRSKVLTESDLKEQFHKKLLDEATRTGDRAFWDAALFTTPLHGKELVALERRAWEATCLAHFAQSYLAMAIGEKELIASDEPVLVEALRLYPEDAELYRYAVALAGKEDKLTDDLLARAMKAEYRRFSVGGIMNGQVNRRPRATTLRGYFAEMKKRTSREQASAD